jgi:ABC-type phosphate/phosphonate transport system substrate-binding protein
MMHVSLPMYDLPELLEDHQQLWNALSGFLRQEGFADLPVALEWPDDLTQIWQSPDLLLSQTCGYPLIHELAPHVQLVGVPHYGAPGCDGYRYSSAVIVHRESNFQSLADLRGSVAGFNERGSQSGYNALRRAIAPFAAGKPFFADVRRTGRHEASIDAVAAGGIDVAAIDAVTFALIARHQPERVAAVRVLGFTQPVPGLPLVTSIRTSAPQLQGLRRALARLAAAPGLDALRRRLLINGYSSPPLSEYAALAEQEAAAAAAGYDTLA